MELRFVYGVAEEANSSNRHEKHKRQLMLE